MSGLEVVGAMFGSAASGLFGQSSAREQMRFQERMANTQYQRAARDLEKAGLNRVLALGNPASAPSGASASMPDLGSSMTGAFNARTQRELSKAQATALEAAAGRDNSATVVNAATAAKTMQETQNLAKQFELLDLEEDKQQFYKQFYNDLSPLARSIFDKIMSGAEGVSSAADAIPKKAGALVTLGKIKAQNAASSVKDVAASNASHLLGNAPVPMVSPIYKLFEHLDNKKRIAPYIRKDKK